MLSEARWLLPSRLYDALNADCRFQLTQLVFML